MLNDLLMLTKFNRNAESERRVPSRLRSLDVDAMRERERKRGRATAARLGLKRGGEY